MNTQIYEEACNWFVDLRAGDVDAAGRKRFNSWIRKSPEHLRAYLEVTEIWQDAPFVDTGHEVMAERLLISAARSEANVLPLEARRSGGARSGARKFSRFAIAASITFLCIATALGAWFLQSRSIYATDIGEQRSVTLPDGSTVQLNARSRMKVRFTGTEREIELLSGQALFSVARDPARPFIVHSDDTQIRAVGTQFDVYRRKSGTTVTVVEGRVAVDESADRHPSARDPIMLSAGEQLTVSPTVTPKARKTDAASATAWTQHRLVLQGSPLPEVAEEFNRYNARPLVITDPRLADFNVSGVYSSADPELLLKFLREQPGISVRETENEILISRRP